MASTIKPNVVMPGGRLPAELMAVHWDLVHERKITILDLLDTVPWFREAANWKPWRAFLAAAYGLPMDEEELSIYRRCTGRWRAPEAKFSEVWMAVGRRGRKSAIAALMGVYEGCYYDRRPRSEGGDGSLAPGERGVIPIVAKDKQDALTIKNFVANGILGSDGMAHLLDGQLGERVRLATGIDIVIRAFGPTAGRSKGVVASLNDEIAFWPTDQASITDEEVLRGIRPGMANVPGAILVGLSSPYAKRGVLYEKYEAYYGQEHDRALFWMAPTLRMHVTDAVRLTVTNEWSDDPVSATAEYGWEEDVQGEAPDGAKAGIHFREDVEIFIDPIVLKALVVTGRRVLAPCSGAPVPPLRPGDQPDPNDQRYVYFAFFDASGGSSDSAALSIAHYDHQSKKAVQDFVREWTAPFKPSQVVKEASEELRRYRLKTVMGDRYAGQWVPDRFADVGIGYVQHSLTKRELYGGLLPNLNNGEVELLDQPRVYHQLKALERRKTHTGIEIIDHPPGGRDDVANATAGALYDAYTQGRFMEAPPPEVRYATTQEIQDKQLADLIAEMEGEGPDRDLWHERWMMQ
jgi:hypothetical protein